MPKLILLGSTPSGSRSWVGAWTLQRRPLMKVTEALLSGANIGWVGATAGQCVVQTFG